MNRYMIYLPDDKTWMEVAVGLQSYGKPQSDSLHLVTLMSEGSMSEIEATLIFTIPQAGKDHTVRWQLSGSERRHQGNALSRTLRTSLLSQALGSLER